MKVLAFGASNSHNSINKKLALYAAQQLEHADIKLIDLNDYEMPIYSEDREQNSGVHPLAHTFFAEITHVDLVIVSFAEYNGTYTAAYKNILDWTSRVDMRIFQGKPVLLLATAPGSNGAKTVLEAASFASPYLGAEVIGALSLSNFYDNFDPEHQKVTDSAFNQALSQAFLPFQTTNDNIGL